MAHGSHQPTSPTAPAETNQLPLRPPQKPTNLSTALRYTLLALALSARPALASPTSIAPQISIAPPSLARSSFIDALDSDRRGDTAAALAAYGRAFQHDPGSRDLCFLYLERLKDAGAVEEALAVATACVALAGDDNPDEAEGAPSAVPSGTSGAEPPPAPLTAAEHKLLGEVALRAEDAPAALRHYRAALRLGGGDEADVLYVLAGLYEDVGDWEGHADAVRRLLPRLGYPVRLMERLARLYVRLDRLPEFMPVLEEAWERTDEPVFGRTLAAHYEANGLNLSLLRTARALAARDPGLEHDALLARAYLLADRPDTALSLTGSLLTRTAAAARASGVDQAERVAEDEGLRFLYATLLFEHGRYREARPYALTLAREAPESPAHHLLAGSILLEMRGRPRAIRAALDQAVRRAPYVPDYRARRAYAEYALSDGRVTPERIATILDIPREPVPAEPEGTPSDTSLAAARRLLREGLAHARLAQELAPREAGQRPAVFTDTAAARRHRRQALARYEALLAPAPTANPTAAPTVDSTANHPASDRTPRGAVQRAALFEAGVQSERLGDLARAKSLFRRLIARDSTHAAAMNYLAYTLIEQDTVPPADMEEAAALLPRALALDPENGAYRDSWGWWHYRQGAYDSARVWLEAAHEAVPGDPAILDHLVRTLQALDRRDEACAWLRRLHAINPRHDLTVPCPVPAP